jgi:carbamoyltransferase
MDYLVLENFLLAKTDQPKQAKDKGWESEFAMD